MLAELSFYRNSYQELLEELQERMIREQKTFLVTANPAIVMQGEKDVTYKKMLLQADYMTPDGIGVVQACKWLGIPVTERIAGFDLMISLLEVADENGWKIYLLGATPKVVSLAKANIAKKYQGATVVGYHHGYFEDDESIIEEIQTTEPDLIFVGMGCPKQERWIYEHLEGFRKGLFIGVGGSIDVLSGLDMRAPESWIKCNLEWLYRIIRKPSRVKVIKDLVRFIIGVLLECFHKKPEVAKKMNEQDLKM